MAWPTTKDLSRYAYNQFWGNFLGFVVGTLAARLVSTFFETKKFSNLWGLTARKTVVSGSTFHFLEWSCALVVGFIAFELVNNLVKEKLEQRISSFIRDRGLMSKLEASAPRLSRTIRLIAPLNESLAASEKNDNDSMC
jgi:hypothetical protein